MELENFILKYYQEYDVWLPDRQVRGPGVGGGPDSEQQKSDVAQGPVGNDQSHKEAIE